RYSPRRDRPTAQPCTANRRATVMTVPTAAFPKDAVLLTIDVQKGMDVFREKYHRNNPDLERNIARLQQAWRESGRPLIHVQHISKQPNSPLRPGQPGGAVNSDRKSTRLNSSHLGISYAVFCLKKKKK